MDRLSWRHETSSSMSRESRLNSTIELGDRSPMNSQGYADTARANQERIRTGDCLLSSMFLHMLLKRQKKIANDCDMRASSNFLKKFMQDLRGRFLRELTWLYSWQRTGTLNSSPLNQEAFPSNHIVRCKLKRYSAP